MRTATEDAVPKPTNDGIFAIAAINLKTGFKNPHRDVASSRPNGGWPPAPTDPGATLWFGQVPVPALHLGVPASVLGSTAAVASVQPSASGAPAAEVALRL